MSQEFDRVIPQIQIKIQMKNPFLCVFMKKENLPNPTLCSLLKPVDKTHFVFISKPQAKRTDFINYSLFIQENNTHIMLPSFALRRHTISHYRGKRHNWELSMNHVAQQWHEFMSSGHGIYRVPLWVSCWPLVVCSVNTPPKTPMISVSITWTGLGLARSLFYHRRFFIFQPNLTLVIHFVTFENVVVYLCCYFRRSTLVFFSHIVKVLVLNLLVLQHNFAMVFDCQVLLNLHLLYFLPSVIFVVIRYHVSSPR